MSSSSRIGILDGPGVDSYCLNATIEQTNELMDENRYQIVKFSEAPNMFDDLHSKPMSLFRVPGGYYKDMIPEFLLLSPKIHHFVKVYGGRYWGECAGGIGASSKMLMYGFPLELNKQNPMQEMKEHPGVEEDKLIKLYSGNSCFFDVREPLSYLPCAIPVSPPSVWHSFALFFNYGVFFPNARSQPNTEILLEAKGYIFSGLHLNEKYVNIAPAIAVKQDVGKGSVLLCGGHTEMSGEIVERIPYDADYEKEAQAKAVPALKPFKNEQMDTAQRFLNKLKIATKV